MLHKSFKAAKCKTSLKLASARLKLMKNKKGVQMNQIKNDLAQLLESGQDRTARIRVEHFIREEKMVAAYDLVELYCELIAARLPIIETQKNCPIDLKEAITSVIFAAPRCADVPELLDVKKHFTAKYGKEFVTAALELRPNCGVGRMLVEKLSAVAPDAQAKFKVLNAIAEERNIKWDSESFEEKETKPVNDMLDGPSTFEKASEMTVETPKIGTSSFQATSSHDAHTRPLNATEQDKVSSLDEHNVSHRNHDGRYTNAATHPDMRYSGNDGKDVRHYFSRNDISSNGEDINLEFKDAMSAAQAAAESAERASMAARAAAELSRRDNNSRQYHSEFQNSTKNSTRHGRPGTYAASKLASENTGNVPVKNSFRSEKSNAQNEHINSDEYQNQVEADERSDTYDQTNTKISSHLTSVRSGDSTIDDNTYIDTMQKPDRYSNENLSKEMTRKEPLDTRMAMKKQYMESRNENLSSWKDDSRSEQVDHFGEARIEKQEHVSSSRSHSSSETDDYVASDDTHQKLGNTDTENLFVGFGKDIIYKDTTYMNTYDEKSAAFDEYDSNDHHFDTGPKYDEGESASYIPSFSSNSLFITSPSEDIWNSARDTTMSPEKATVGPDYVTKDHSSSLFSKNSAQALDHIDTDNVSVTPYDLDGPKFDSEDEVELSINEGVNSSEILSKKHDVLSLDSESAQSANHGSTESLFVDRKDTGYDRGSRAESSSSDDLESVEAHLKYKPVTVLNAESSEFDDSIKDRQHVHQSSSPSLAYRDKDSFHPTGSADILKLENLQQQSNPEEDNKLNFGTLTGGFRNKGYRHPPYIRKSSGGPASLTPKTTNESATIIEQQMAPPSIRSSVDTTLSNDAKNKQSFSTSNYHTDSDSHTDDTEEEVQEKTNRRRQAPETNKSSKEVTYKSSYKPPVQTYFDLDNDDYNEDVPKQNFPDRGQLGSAISRRTKPSPSSAGTRSKTQAAQNNASTSPKSSKERTGTISLHETENPTKLKSEMETVTYSVGKEQPSFTEKVSSNASFPVSSFPEKSSNSSVGQPSSGRTNEGASSSLQTAKTSTLKAEPPTREDSAKRASHVHPKLPDYDSLAAQLLSLRKDQQ